MSVFNECQIDNFLDGITSNKGEILINDGISNVALPTGITGSLLKFDITQPQGAVWETTTNLFPSLSAGHYLANTNYTTTAIFESIDINTIVLQNNTNIIERDGGDISRINIKVAGIYYVAYHALIDDVATLRLIANGLPLLSTEKIFDYVNNNNATGGDAASTTIVSLVANSYISIQATSTAPGTLVKPPITISVIKLDGVVGPSGPPGPSGDIEWKGEWQISTAYNINEAVFYQGSSYVNTTTSNNNAPDIVSSGWDLLASRGADGVDGLSFIWQNVWSTSTIYVINEIVFYNGSSYISIQSPNENNQPDISPLFWNIMSLAGTNGLDGVDGQDGVGFIWRSVWNGGSNYSTNDVVFYNGSSYISIQNTNIGNLPDTSPLSWELYAQKGIDGAPGDLEWKGNWVDSISYITNDVVFYQGSSYVATTTTFIGNDPITNSSSQWDLVAQGGTTLKVLQARRTTNYTMTATFTSITFDATDIENDAFVINHNDTNREQFEILETGLYRVDYTAVMQSGSTRVVILPNTIIPQSICTSELPNADFSSSSCSFIYNFNTGDILVFQGQGVSLIRGPLLLTITKLDGVKGNPGIPGPPGDFNWMSNWLNSTFYNINDVVYFNGSSYVCILAHTSSPSIEPTNLTYWNIVSLGGVDGIDGTSFTWRGLWSSGSTYAINDVSQFNGSSYISLQNANLNNQPDTAPTFWDIVALKGIDGTSFTWRGTWSGATTYNINDVVYYQGSSYIALQNNISGGAPDLNLNTLWDIVAQQASTILQTYKLNSQVVFSTTSTSYVSIPTTTFTPIAGTYMATFSCVYNWNAVNQSVSIAIHVAGVIQPVSLTVGLSTSFNGSRQDRLCALSQDIITVNGSQNVDVRILTNINTVNVRSRTFILVKVG